MSPPSLEKVIEDCNSALKLDNAYLKALKRRASTLEALDRDEEAVRGEFWFLVISHGKKWDSTLSWVYDDRFHRGHFVGGFKSPQEGFR